MKIELLHWSILKNHLKKVKIWPSCSIFGIFDGINGHECSEYLANNLLSQIINDASFLLNTDECLKRSIALIDNLYEKEIENFPKKKIPRSSIVIGVFIKQQLFAASVGFSNALICNSGGQNKIVILDDLITMEELLKQKAEQRAQLFNISNKKGLEDYLSQYQLNEMKVLNFAESSEKLAHKNFSSNEGYRLKYIGNFSNKYVKNSTKIIKNFYDEIELKQILISKSSDFVFFSSEGLYTKIKSDDIFQMIYKSLSMIDKLIDFNQFCKSIITKIVLKAFQSKCKENISIIFIAFQSFKIKFENQIEKIMQINPCTKIAVNMKIQKPIHNNQKKRQNSCLDIRKNFNWII